MEQRRVGRILNHIGWKTEGRRVNKLTGQTERVRKRNVLKTIVTSGNNGNNGKTQTQQDLQLYHIPQNNGNHLVGSQLYHIDSVSGNSETQSQQAVYHDYQINQIDSRLFENKSPDWKPISTVGLENLYRGDWVACSDGIPLKLETRRKKFWEATPKDSKESLEIPFAEISLVYR